MRETKGVQTRRRILDQVGPIFNERGYQATTLAHVMKATGLEKGGIYNHFASKDELAMAAYVHNADIQADLITARVRQASGAVDRLVAVIDAFRAFAHDPPFPGGCPTLNTAVESGNLDARLHARARERMSRLLDLVRELTRRGVSRAELRPVDPDQVASLIAASIEGALLLHQLYDDPRHVDLVTDHLERYVRSLALEES